MDLFFSGTGEKVEIQTSQGEIPDYFNIFQGKETKRISFKFVSIEVKSLRHSNHNLAYPS